MLLYVVHEIGQVALYLSRERFSDRAKELGRKATKLGRDSDRVTEQERDRDRDRLTELERDRDRTTL